jgi:hypothetical protein
MNLNIFPTNDYDNKQCRAPAQNKPNQTQFPKNQGRFRPPSASGGYITKGTSICQMNAIHKEVLQSQVTETVLDFYRSYLEKGGRQKLAEAVKAQTGVEKEDLTSARQVSSNVQTDPLSQRKSSNSFDNLISSVALSCRSGTFTPTESLALASATGSLLTRTKQRRRVPARDQVHLERSVEKHTSAEVI